MTTDRPARSAVLTTLVAIALLGVGWDVMTFLESQKPYTGGDGLGMVFPAFGVLLFVPFQLLAAAAVASALWKRSGARKASAEPEERASDPVLANLVAFLAGALLSLPALVMLGVMITRAVVPHPSDALHDTLFRLAQPMTLVWGPTWALGMVVAGVAFGRYERPLPLLLTPLYPLLGAAYMFS